MVLSVLTATAATQSVVYGGLLLLVFGLGRTVPLFVAGFSAVLLQRLEALAQYSIVFEKTFGVIFLGLGGYYLFQFWPVVRIYLDSL